MIEIVESLPKGVKAGLCVCLVHEGDSLVKHTCADEAMAAAAKADGFIGKKDQSFYVPTSRSLILGLGKAKDADLEVYRRAGMAAARRSRDLKIEAAEICLPKGATKEQAGAVAEGAWLGLYKFTEAKGKPADQDKASKDPELKRLALNNAPKGSAAVLAERRLACEAVILVRDLVNRGPAGHVALHRLHGFVRLQRQAAAVERDALADQHHVVPRAAGVVAQLDHPGRPDRPGADGQDPAKSLGGQLGLVPDP